MNKKHILRKRIKSIRQTLDDINGNEVQISYKPIQIFPDKKCYPIEFQIFMEEIGRINIVTNDYQLIHLNCPAALVSNNKPEDDWETTFASYGLYKKDESYNGVIAEKIRIIGWDIDNNEYYFDASKIPFQFHDYHDSSKDKNIVEWFVQFINVHLDYIMFSEKFRLK